MHSAIVLHILLHHSISQSYHTV